MGWKTVYFDPNGDWYTIKVPTNSMWTSQPLVDAVVPAATAATGASFKYRYPSYENSAEQEETKLRYNLVIGDNKADASIMIIRKKKAGTVELFLGRFDAEHTSENINNEVKDSVKYRKDNPLSLPYLDLTADGLKAALAEILTDTADAYRKTMLNASNSNTEFCISNMDRLEALGSFGQECGFQYESKEENGAWSLEFRRSKPYSVLRLPVNTIKNTATLVTYGLMGTIRGGIGLPEDRERNIEETFKIAERLLDTHRQVTRLFAEQRGELHITDDEAESDD